MEKSININCIYKIFKLYKIKSKKREKKGNNRSDKYDFRVL